MSDDEKRKVTTFLKPELLQIFLPLIFAAGSGFLLHDRAISALETELAKYTEDVRDHDAEIKGVPQILGELLVLRDRISRLESSQRMDEEVNVMVRSLQQQTEFTKEQLKDIQVRLRDLERQVDKLTK